MAPQVAVVGAGVAGSAVAHALGDADVSVTLFEKNRNVSGRAATRRRLGCTYDYGANYLSDDDERVTSLIEGLGDGLVTVDGDVWTFDADGQISEGREGQSAKFTYRDGIDQLSEALLRDADHRLFRETVVDEPIRGGDDWRLIDRTGREHGSFDALVLTPPAPLTADLLGDAQWSHGDRRTLRQAVESVPYRTITSAVLHYPFELDRPFYALVNEDREHDVGWLSREECKPGHVPDGESLLVVQFAPDWSVDRFRDSDADLAAAAAAEAADLLDDDRLTDPDWTDCQRFRYALPDAGFEDGHRERAASHALFFAGDWVAGEARLHAAIRSGLDAGKRVREHFDA